MMVFGRLAGYYKKAIAYFSEYGLGIVISKVLRKIGSFIRYQLWIKKNEPNYQEIQAQRTVIFDINPKISIIVPTYNTNKIFLCEMIESVLCQTYSNWELCIADGGSDSIYEIESILTSYAYDKRIKYVMLNENKGIAGNTNAALSLAEGEFIALLDHDDILATFALYEVVASINKNTNCDFIYSDEDKFTKKGSIRYEPYFKSDFAPDVLRSSNYICHLSVIRKTLIDRIGGFCEDYDGSQDYDMILRATEVATEIIHIPKVLYHWRVHRQSTAGNTNAKMYAYTAAKKAIESHLSRVGLEGSVEDGEVLGIYKINYQIKSEKKVSIILLNKDAVHRLKASIQSIRKKTTYRNYEIIIVDNNSIESETLKYYDSIKMSNDIKVVEWSRKDFNISAAINYGVSFASGENILLLISGATVITDNWIDEMVMYLQREDVGVVGARLYDSNRRIYQSGVIVGKEGTVNNIFRKLQKKDIRYFGRNIIVQNLSAVSGSCLMIKKEIFELVGGLDEIHFKNSYADIDLCLKVLKLGKLIAFTPFAELYCKEAKTHKQFLGFSDNRDCKDERLAFASKWHENLKTGDKYYNINLSMKGEGYKVKVCK